MKDFEVLCRKHGKFLGVSICPVCLREEEIEKIVCEKTKYLEWEIFNLRKMLKETHLQRQITATELGNSINEFAGQTDWDTDPMKIAKNIILKYKVLSK